VDYPEMFLVEQTVDAPEVSDLESEILRELSRPDIASGIRPGDRVAVTAGSRGIDRIDIVIRTVIGFLLGRGARPFVVPSMGSHGHGTPEGQLEVLRKLGITEESVGAPIVPAKDYTAVGTFGEGLPVYVAGPAYGADRVVVVNRVKPHTEFDGEFQSGLMKMLLIGLGGPVGAKIYHGAAVRTPFDTIARSAGRIVLERCKVAFGIALVENAYGRIALVKGVRPEEFEEADIALQKKSQMLSMKLPFDYMDLLIVDEMGKNISGSGMDTNVIGRKSWSGFMENRGEKPLIMRIFVRDLTPKSSGNAAGIGLADFTTERLIRKIDLKATYLNCITSTRPRGAMLPMAFRNDREAVDAALSTLGVTRTEDARVVRIKNTLRLGRLKVSKAMLDEVGENRGLKVIDGPERLCFDREGNLPPFEPGDI